MAPIRTDDYEIVARQRTKLPDGTWGWTGVYRAAYSIDKTVVGRGEDWVFVPLAYQVGAAGSASEREYAKQLPLVHGRVDLRREMEALS